MAVNQQEGTTDALYATWREARRAYLAVCDERIAWMDKAIEVEYKRRREEDKAAGRDTSRGSVQRRRQLAYDAVMMSDEGQAWLDRVAAVDAVYRAAQEVVNADRRDPEYLRFLETYTYERFLADGKIGPLPAFRRAKEKQA